MQLTPWPIQAFDDNGVPLAGGKLYAYEAGTSTPKDMYADALSGTPTQNPLILDSAGRGVAFLGPGAYKLILTDANDTAVWPTLDNISVGGGVGSMALVNTMADLRALTDGAYDAVILLGYNTVGDGGGGLFHWDSANTGTEDYGVVIVPDDAPTTGRWIRDFDGKANVRYFGAYGNHTTDDATAIGYAAAFAATEGCPVLVPFGKFLIVSDPGLGSVPTIMEPSGSLYWTAAINPPIKPIISINDYTQHFFCSSSHAPAVSSVDVLRPEWFGAVHDGTTTDDTDAIATMFKAPANAYVGCRIELYPGATYLLKTTLGFSLNSVANFIVNGNGAAFKAYTSTIAAMFSINGCSHIEISNLILDGNNHTTDGFKFAPVSSYANTRIKFKDVYVVNCTGAAFRMGTYISDATTMAINDSTFENIEIANCGNAVIYDAPLNTNVLFEDLKITGNATEGHTIEVLSGNLTIRHITYALAGSLASNTNWVFYVYYGSVNVDGGTIYGKSLRGLVRMELTSDRVGYLTSYPSALPGSSFRNVKMMGYGAAAQTGLNVVGTLVWLKASSRNLRLVGCDVSYAYADSETLPAATIQTDAGCGTLVSVGNRYSVYDANTLPWVNTYNLPNILRSVGDVFYVATFDSPNWTTTDVILPDSLYAGNQADADVLQHINTGVTTTDSSVYSGQFHRWDGTVSNAPVQLGKLGFVGNNAADANFRLYMATSLAMKIDSSKNSFWYGRMSQATPATVTATTNLTLGSANMNYVTTGTAIVGIKPDGWNSGAMVWLQATGASFDVTHMGSPSAGYDPIALIDTIGTRTIAQGSTLFLLYDSGVWLEISQSPGRAGPNVASTTNLTLPTNYTFCNVTGANQISMIATDNQPIGKIVYLKFASNLTIKHKTGSTSGYAQVFASSEVDDTVPANHTRQFIYDGTYWYDWVVEG